MSVGGLDSIRTNYFIIQYKKKTFLEPLKMKVSNWVCVRTYGQYVHT